MKYIRQFLFLVVIGIISQSLVGCAESEPSVEQISRISSSDGQVDAVILRKNVHSTVPFITELHILPKGEKPEDAYMILRGDKFENISLKWKENKFLEIHYDRGRVFQFRNFWSSKKVENFTYVVEIRLKPSSDSFSLGR